MLFYFKKGKNTTETHTKKICAVNGKGAVTGRICQKWLEKVCAGDFSLGGVLRSGRLVEVDSDDIKTLIENNQHYIAQDIADILKIPKSIKLLVKMKTMCLLFYRKKNYKDFLANPIQ